MRANSPQSFVLLPKLQLSIDRINVFGL